MLELQQEIQNTHTKENELSKELEDPENKKRWRELQGADPEDEVL